MGRHHRQSSKATATSSLGQTVYTPEHGTQVGTQSWATTSPNLRESKCSSYMDSPHPTSHTDNMSRSPSHPGSSGMTQERRPSSSMDQRSMSDLLHKNEQEEQTKQFKQYGHHNQSHFPFTTESNFIFDDGLDHESLHPSDFALYDAYETHKVVSTSSADIDEDQGFFHSLTSQAQLLDKPHSVLDPRTFLLPDFPDIEPIHSPTFQHNNDGDDVRSFSSLSVVLFLSRNNFLVFLFFKFICIFDSKCYEA